MDHIATGRVILGRHVTTFVCCDTFSNGKLRSLSYHSARLQLLPHDIFHLLLNLPATLERDVAYGCSESVYNPFVWETRRAADLFWDG